MRLVSSCFLLDLVDMTRMKLQFCSRWLFVVFWPSWTPLSSSLSYFEDTSGTLLYMDFVAIGYHNFGIISHIDNLCHPRKVTYCWDRGHRIDSLSVFLPLAVCWWILTDASRCKIVFEVVVTHLYPFVIFYNLPLTSSWFKCLVHGYCWDSVLKVEVCCGTVVDYS